MALLPTDIGNGGENELADRPDDAPDTSGCLETRASSAATSNSTPRPATSCSMMLCPAAICWKSARRLPKQTWPAVIHARVLSRCLGDSSSITYPTPQAVQLSGRVRTAAWVSWPLVGHQHRIDLCDPPVHHGRVVTDSNGEFSIPVAMSSTRSAEKPLVSPTSRGGHFATFKAKGSGPSMALCRTSIWGQQANRTVDSGLL